MKLNFMNRQQKRCLFNTITSIVNTGLITSTVTAAFAIDVGVRVGVTLSATSLLFSLATAIT